MKTPVQLWVRLKVIDLVTQTARITLTEKLDFAGTLAGMTHYWYWGMEAEAADAAGALEEIDRAIRLDSAFTNQNKHLYRLSAGGRALGDLALEKDYAVGSGADTSAEGPFGGFATGPGAEVSAPGTGFRAGISALFAFDCLVRERRPDRETGFAARLNARLKGVTVSNMKCGEMWRLVVSAPDERQALAAVERMLVSRSRREGLLLNPHYQTYEILATTRLDAEGSAAAVRAKE
jgi:hypothetical protein